MYINDVIRERVVVQIIFSFQIFTSFAALFIPHQQRCWCRRILSETVVEIRCQAKFLTPRHVRMHRLIFYMSIRWKT